LDVTLHASDIIASEKLVEFSNILIGRSVTLDNMTSNVLNIGYRRYTGQQNYVPDTE